VSDRGRKTNKITRAFTKGVLKNIQTDARTLPPYGSELCPKCGKDWIGHDFCLGCKQVKGEHFHLHCFSCGFGNRAGFLGYPFLKPTWVGQCKDAPREKDVFEQAEELLMERGKAR